MAHPQALLTFPGIPTDYIVSWSYSCGHGLTPGFATVVVVPNALIAKQIGDVEIRFGRVRIKLSDCAIDTGSIRGGSGAAATWSIRILDRRWKWKYTEPVNGRYNVRDRDQNIDTKVFKEKTPQELAEICLKAMGEKGYDVKKLPNDARPEVTWNDENAAEMLDELVNSLGCRIVYDFLDDKVKIWPEGEGKELPKDELAMNLSVGHSRETIPSSLLVSFGPTVYQAKWELDPLGEETDGSFVPIDDLSYRPAAGWGDAGDVADPEATYERDGATFYVSELAEKSIYRIWRIKSLADRVEGIVAFGAGGDDAEVLTSGKIDQVNLNDVLIDTVDDGKGGKKPSPAYVEGEFYDPLSDGTTSPGTRWPHGVSIDKDRRLVILSEPAYKLGADADKTPGPATLYLHTSYTVADPDQGVLHHTISRKIAKTGTGPRIIKAPYLARTVKQRYRNATTPDEILTNNPTLQREADTLFKAEQEKLKPHKVDDVEYAGIRNDIHLDGAIQQITIRGGGGQAGTTRVGRNNEPESTMPSYDERRRRERQAAAETAAKVRKVIDTFTTFGEEVLKRAKSFLPWS